MLYKSIQEYRLNVLLFFLNLYLLLKFQLFFNYIVSKLQPGFLHKIMHVCVLMLLCVRVISHHPASLLNFVNRIFNSSTNQFVIALFLTSKYIGFFHSPVWNTVYYFAIFHTSLSQDILICCSSFQLSAKFINLLHQFFAQGTSPFANFVYAILIVHLKSALNLHFTSFVTCLWHFYSNFYCMLCFSAFVGMSP